MRTFSLLSKLINYGFIQNVSAAFSCLALGFGLVWPHSAQGSGHHFSEPSVVMGESKRNPVQEKLHSPCTISPALSSVVSAQLST